MVDRLPRVLLHVEGAVVAAVSVTVYLWAGYPWWLLVVLALAPDLAMLAYLAGPRIGALVYDLAHTYALAVPLAALGLVADLEAAVQIGLIWIAHIGIDRAVGYGLKYPTRFDNTHLQRV